MGLLWELEKVVYVKAFYNRITQTLFWKSICHTRLHILLYPKRSQKKTFIGLYSLADNFLEWALVLGVRLPWVWFCILLPFSCVLSLDQSLNFYGSWFLLPKDKDNNIYLTQALRRLNKMIYGKYMHSVCNSRYLLNCRSFPTGPIIDDH